MQDCLPYPPSVKKDTPTKIIIARYFAGISLLVAGFYFLFCFATNALLEFLRVNEPVRDAEVLIVEGWLSGEFGEFVKDEFQKGTYKYILISGYSHQIDPNYDGEEIADYDISHDTPLASMLLTKEIDSSMIKTINVPDSIKIHRTFAMARAAGKWLYNNDPSVRRVNICTAWSHGRKTWTAHRRILGDSFNIGILTFPKETLPMQKWWTTRSGFRGQAWAFANYTYAVLWPVSLVPDWN